MIEIITDTDISLKKIFNFFENQDYDKYKVTVTIQKYISNAKIITIDKKSKVVIKYFPDTNISNRYRSWEIPSVIFQDIISSYKKKYKCKYCKIFEYENDVYIKRTDIYTLIGYSIPKIVLDYMVKKGC